MSKDFFEIIEFKISTLNDSEKKLLDYTVKNISSVKNMGIREFAENVFVSTTSIFRFVKKLGFKGYSDFINSLIYTEYKHIEHDIPEVLKSELYSEEYLQNIVESVRVLSKSKFKRFKDFMMNKPNIFFLSSGLSNEIALYGKSLFRAYGYLTFKIDHDYDIVAAMNQMKDNDILFVISYKNYSGIVPVVERIKAQKNINVISITEATNNVIQSVTDLDFYIFTDEVSYNEIDVTSRVSMIAILELLGFSLIKK